MNQGEKIIELLAEIKALKEENAKYKEKKDYGLVWDNERNKEEIVEDCKKKLPILERVKDKEIITDKTKPMNLMVEGDNYHALTCLNYTHRGKIDVIYIDPPYNTGAKDWKYNNNYVDKEDRFRHSKWINMMYNRLFIAKNLLKENGILICAIDHYELFNLGLLCDEIFGEENQIGVISVEIKPEGRTSKQKEIAYSNEFYLIYASEIEKSNINNTNLEEEEESLIQYKFKDNISKYKLRDFMRTGGTSTPEERPNSYYPIYFLEKTKKILLENIDGSIEINPIDSKGKKRVWRKTPNSCLNLIKENNLVVEMKRGNYKVLIKDRIKNKGKYTSFWYDRKYNATAYGTNLLKNIIGENYFDFPKSLYAVLDFLKLTSKKDSTVLDFFAGSGTTGHAVLELNKKDGGNRKFILCTNNENNNGNGHGGIAETVCYPRIQKVIEGYKKNGDGELVAGLGGNLHYFKADENSFISIEMLKNISDKKRLELTLKAGELIAIRENIFDEKEHSKYYQIFEDD